MTRTSVCLNSYAKINLFLDVCGKLPGGYHSIRTVFSEIALCDELKFTLTKSGKVEILTNIDTLRGQDNLVYRVAVFLQSEYNINAGVRVELMKNIPIAAGLGGGSSNASTTLLALNQLWQIGLTLDDLHKIAAGFGSDINFFLEGGTAIGLDRGDKITPLPYIDIPHILLVNPGFGVSSGEAYRLVTNHNPDDRLDKLLQFKNPIYCYNRLQAGVEQAYPKLAWIRENCLNLGAVNSMLSGSGATVIGFFCDAAAAEKAARWFENQGCWSNITYTQRRTA